MSAEELRSMLEAQGIRIPPSGYVRPDVVAQILDVSVQTLTAWRRLGVPPHGVRIGGSWRYPIAALSELLTVRPTT